MAAGAAGGVCTCGAAMTLDDEDEEVVEVVTDED